jgi:hypothetical protein
MALVSVFLGLLVLSGLLMRRAAQRYEAHQRELGNWDEYGPLVETEPPPSATRGGTMNWHLEVIGKWKGRIIAKRRPHEPPS